MAVLEEAQRSHKEYASAQRGGERFGWKKAMEPAERSARQHTTAGKSQLVFVPWAVLTLYMLF